MGRASMLRASFTRMSTWLNWESNASMARWTPPGSASETATPRLLSPARPALGPRSKAFNTCSSRSGVLAITKTEAPASTRYWARKGASSPPVVERTATLPAKLNSGKTGTF